MGSANFSTPIRQDPLLLFLMLVMLATAETNYSAQAANPLSFLSRRKLIRTTHMIANRTKDVVQRHPPHKGRGLIPRRLTQQIQFTITKMEQWVLLSMRCFRHRTARGAIRNTAQRPTTSSTVFKGSTLAAAPPKGIEPFSGRQSQTNWERFTVLPQQPSRQSGQPINPQMGFQYRP